MTGTWRRRGAAAALAGAATAALLAVVGATTAQQGPAEKERLDRLDAGPSQIDVRAYPADQQRAYKLFSAKCAACHALARGINSDMVLPGEWERYVKRMMFKPNSGISSEEGKALYRFLVYDAAARKPELLRGKLAELPAEERAAAWEKVREINPSFTLP